MQFYLDGFHAGDPLVPPGRSNSETALLSRGAPDQVDVLIVGSGPAGLTLAAQLSAFPGIVTRVLEQKSEALKLGQADGIACRTMEMFHAFGIADRIMKEAYFVNEVAFWRPDPDRPEHITRGGRVQDVEDGLSEFPHVILNQARVHDFYLDLMRQAPAPIVPTYSRRLTALRRESGEYPIVCEFTRLEEEHQGECEVIRARYVVGCDGARSTVREALGLKLEGDSAHQLWGVMDVLANTTFPDVRLKATIHSGNNGNGLLIPREGGYLFRLYIELDKLNENERANSRNLRAEDLIAKAQQIFQPYSLDVKEVAWFSIYEIGQRICPQFDDSASLQGVREPRVFIAGDACHTHSPKAGQGMNVSMQDTFNLGWKLAAVLEGRSKPEILRTYAAERRAIAQELIDFDRQLAALFNKRANEGDAEEGVDPVVFQSYFVRQGRFTAGVATCYQPSVITGENAHQQLAVGFPIGQRLHSAPVIRLADALPMHLGHAFTADGRWRVLAFSDGRPPADPACPVRRLCHDLENAPESPLRAYTPNGANIDAVLDVRAVYPQAFRELRLEDMPGLLLPQKGRLGLRDYEKIFCSDTRPGRDIFDLRGIDRQRGCMLVVRPDQHVANILPIDGCSELAAFFAQFMIARP